MISIIIPIYNSSVYLRDCLDSIQRQSFPEWECILVNDGSQDNSGAICLEYCKKDSRFVLFDKQNGGVSSARNYGIEKARGEWIMFVDSDDTLLPDALSYCFSYTSGSSMVCACCQAIHMDGRPYSSPLMDPSNTCTVSKEYAKDILSYNTLCAPFCKLINREKIGTIRFDERLDKGEDAQFLVSILSADSFNVRKCNKVIYNYRIHNNSLSHGNSKKNIESALRLITYLEKRKDNKLMVDLGLLPYFAFNICHNIIEIVSLQGLSKKLGAKELSLFYRCYLESPKELVSRPPYKLLSFFCRCPFLANLFLSLYFLPIQLYRMLKRIV